LKFYALIYQIGFLGKHHVMIHCIGHALRPKITYAGKAVKLHKQILNETITAVRSVNYVPDKIY